MCGDGKTERKVRRREQAGANAWRAVEGVMADRRISKTKGQGHEHLCDTDIPVRNGNLGTDRTTTIKAASVRKQLQWVRTIARVTRADAQEKNGGVKGRDGSAEELNRETGEGRQEKNGGVKGRDGSVEELHRETGEGRQEKNGGVKGRYGSAEELNRETGEGRQEKNGGVKGRDGSAEELNRETGEGRQAKNGGVKGRDGSAEELDRETGAEQITVGRAR